MVGQTQRNPNLSDVRSK